MKHWLLWVVAVTLTLAGCEKETDCNGCGSGIKRTYFVHNGSNETIRLDFWTNGGNLEAVQVMPDELLQLMSISVEEQRGPLSMVPTEYDSASISVNGVSFGVFDQNAGCISAQNLLCSSNYNQSDQRDSSFAFQNIHHTFYYQ